MNYPVPCDGVRGEMLYLENLVFKNGIPFIFHRLMSKKNNSSIIDIYEIVSCDGKIWDLLYLDMYNEYRTEFVPYGYKEAVRAEELNRFILGLNNPHIPQLNVDQTVGSNLRYKDFPLGVLIENNELFHEDERAVIFFNFKRPKAHLDKLAAIGDKLNR